MRIILVGFMGSGKSVVGKYIAERLKFDFVDLDTVIENKEGDTINHIFETKGEKCFRELETNTLCQEIQKEDIVMATGGGIVLDPNNIDLLLDKGFCICLTASENEISKRMSHSKHRPLLNTEDSQIRIKDLLKQRKPLYDIFPNQLDTTGLSVQQVADRIMTKLEMESK